MVAFIGVTALMIFNLVLYHKIFGVIYFDLGKGLLKEIVGAYIAAVIELGLLMTVGQAILGFILAAFGWLFGIVAIVAVLGIVVFIVYRIVKMIKGKVSDNENKSDDDSAEINTKNNPIKAEVDNNSVQEDINISKENENFNNKMGHNDKKENIFCMSCGKEILRTAKFCKFCGRENVYGNGENEV